MKRNQPWHVRRARLLADAVELVRTRPRRTGSKCSPAKRYARRRAAVAHELAVDLIHVLTAEVNLPRNKPRSKIAK